MRNSVYDLLEQPTGATYRSLLEACSTYSAALLVVVREPDWLTPSGLATLRRLEPFLLARTIEQSWPGTVLLEDTATIFRYSLCPSTLQIVKDGADGLYEWQQPRLPEDLCFLRDDGDTVLVTIAHERDAYLTVTDAERREIQAAVPALPMTRHVVVQRPRH